MRMLRATLLAASLVAPAAPTIAAAQDAMPPAFPAPGASAGGAPVDNLPPGVLPQPSINAPGLVLGVSAGELYSDNVKLAPRGKPRESSWITVIEPFIRAARSSPRFSGVVNYQLSAYLYGGHSSTTQLGQNLDAQGTLTILPQHLFLDGLARYGHTAINDQLPSGQGAYFLDNNRVNIAVASLSPYWTQDFGRVGTLLLRYTHGRVAYNRHGLADTSGNPLAGIPDITSDAIQFNLTSPVDQKFGWNLDYTRQHLSPDFGQGITFATAKAGASLQLNPNTRLLADVGRENKYLPDGSVDQLGATFWDVGVAWATALNNVRLLVGHRFYGRSTEFSWTHTAALLTTTLSYIEQPTDINQQLLGSETGAALTLPTGVSWLPSLRNRRVYLMKRATATASYEMPRGRLNLDLYDEHRDFFLQDSGHERVSNASLSWLFDLGAQTTLLPQIGWQRYRFETGQVSYNRFAMITAKHQFGPKDFITLRYRNDSSTVYSPMPGAHGYRVNLLFAQWTHQF